MICKFLKVSKTDIFHSTSGLTVISSVEDPSGVLTVTFAMPLALVRPLTPPGLTSTSTFLEGVWSGFVT